MTCVVACVLVFIRVAICFTPLHSMHVAVFSASPCSSNHDALMHFAESRFPLVALFNYVRVLGSGVTCIQRFLAFSRSGNSRYRRHSDCAIDSRQQQTRQCEHNCMVASVVLGKQVCPQHCSFSNALSCLNGVLTSTQIGL